MARIGILALGRLFARPTLGLQLLGRGIHERQDVQRNPYDGRKPWQRPGGFIGSALGVHRRLLGTPNAAQMAQKEQRRDVGLVDQRGGQSLVSVPALLVGQARDDSLAHAVVVRLLADVVPAGVRHCTAAAADQLFGPKQVDEFRDPLGCEPGGAGQGRRADGASARTISSSTARASSSSRHTRAQMTSSSLRG